MALVLFRVSGPAASQQLDSQLLQIGPHSLLLHQWPQRSGNTEHLQRSQEQQTQYQGVCSGTYHDLQPLPSSERPDLSRVGFVVWQSGFILADFLLMRHPQLPSMCAAGSRNWAGVRLLELGCGAGTVGMFLALAGAQVVLTDQAHVLPLAQQNMDVNSFSAQTHNSQSIARQGTVDQQATEPALAAAMIAPVTQQSKAAAPAYAASINLVAMFGGAASWDTAEEVQQQPPQNAHAQVAWQLFAPGPLLVEYSWGEPADVLQERLATAASARLSKAAAVANNSICNYGGIDNSVITNSNDGARDQQQQQHPAFHQHIKQPARHAAQQQGQPGNVGQPQVLSELCSFDVIVGADLLYNPDSHQQLLSSLQQLAAPHTQVFLCYRQRGLGECQFEEAAAAAGWLVQEVPSHMVHHEYQGGEYRLICLSKLN